MPNVLSVASAFLGLGATKKRPGNARISPVDFYQLRVYDIRGNAIDMADFKGKKLLLVNVASKCGFTPQYRDLQKLHELYSKQVTILGFPSNDFKRQEPHSNAEIAEFCELNYGVGFQMMQKISVKGPDQSPLYRWLTRKDFNGWCDQEPEWNFCKYLVNEEGQLTHYFNMGVKPLSSQIIKAIT